MTSEPDGDRSEVTGQALVARELRRHRERAGLSRNQLAARVGYSRTYISTCEKPGATLVSEAVVKRIDEELQAGGLLITLRARAEADRMARRAGAEIVIQESDPIEGTNPVVAATPIGQAFEGADLSETESGDTSVQRRDFLKSGSTLAFAGLLAPLVPVLGREGTQPDLVDELSRRLDSLRLLDSSLGGADTYRLYEAEAAVSAHLLTSGTCSGTVHRGLLGLFSDQSQQAGWAAFDAGWHGVAEQHYQRSLTAANEAGDVGLVGNALAFQAYQQIAAGRPARRLSERSVQVAGAADVTPGVRTLLYSRAAWTFALDGDVETTVWLLGQAEEEFANRGSAPTPGYSAWIDEIELAIMTGRCWSELRRPLRAVPVLESALGRYDGAHIRDKAMYSSWLADSYIDAGEIEQAVQVLRTGTSTLARISSVRPRRRLAAVANRLSEFDKSAAVREFFASDALDPIGIRR